MIYPERVRWIDVPAEVRAALEPMLVYWLPIAPGWLEDLTVEYGEAREGETPFTMQSTIKHSNRWAVLTVSGAWLAEPDEERENILRHELAHLLTEPLRLAAMDVVCDALEDGSTARRMAEREISEAAEAVVEDLARGMQRLFQSKVAP